MKTESRAVVISAPKFQTAVFRIVGTSPYLQNKFSEKERQKMHDTQAAGQQAKKGCKRDPKDFQARYEAATYRTPDGKFGIPATAFRKAMISACRTVGFKMTIAKLSVFVEADGWDGTTPLVFFVAGTRRYSEEPVRNDSGVCDLRPRPLWEPGWQADVRVRFDADQFTLEDVTNLMMRVGQQVGIGEGRPDSTSSCGMGWGMFDLDTTARKGKK